MNTAGKPPKLRTEKRPLNLATWRSLVALARVIYQWWQKLDWSEFKNEG